MIRSTSLALLCGLAAVMTACSLPVPSNITPEPESGPLPDTTVVLTWRFPVFTPRQGSARQEKGAVAILVAPRPFEKRTVVQTVDEPYRPVGAWPCASYLHRRAIPMVGPEARDIAFLVTVRNGLPHVFRGAGALAALNVNGQPVALEQSGYADLTNVLLVPQSQAQVVITGPATQALPDSGLVELTIYDVTTATDSAGNPARREVFRWYFDYAARPTADTIVVHSSDVRQLTPGCRPTSGGHGP